MEMEGHYQKGPHSIEVYLKQTAIANPHLAITYKDPQGEEIRFARSTKTLPPRPVEIKPHPYGIELGRLHSDAEQHRKPHLAAVSRRRVFLRGEEDGAQDHRTRPRKALRQKTKRSLLSEAHRSRAGDRAAQGYPENAHPGAADGLHRPDRREAAARRAAQGAGGGLLHRHHPASRGLPGQPVPGGSRDRLWPPR